MQGQGKGVKSPGANVSALAPLTPGYIKQRAKDKNLSSKTTPSTSNLTRTGEMLDSLEVTVSETKVSVNILDGKALKKAIWTHQFRPWVHISKGERTKLKEYLNKLIKNKLP